MSAPALPSSAAVCDLLRETLTSMVLGTASPTEDPPADVKPLLDRLLEKPSTLRDGVLTLLAYPVAAGAPLSYGEKFRGARSVSQYLADLLVALQIEGRRDALQTQAKGTAGYLGRSRDWDDPLVWAAAQDDIEPVRRAFRYLAAGMAETARGLPPMPELDTPRLTFAGVFSLLDALLSTASGGAHEQFIFAAVLEAYLLGQLDEPGTVDTKNIHASDASAGSAADVQHRQRGQVLAAYEVTGNDWRTKVGQALATMATHDLRRVTILGRRVVDATGEQVAASLPGDIDVIVLDVREEIRSLVGRLDKHYRREALNRLYAHLLEKQSDNALVQAYVDELAARGLTL